MSDLYQFEQIGSEFIAYISRDQIPLGMSYDVMKFGGIYSGSSVLAMLFPDSIKPHDIDCYVSKHKYNSTKIFNILNPVLEKEFLVYDVHNHSCSRYSELNCVENITNFNILSKSSNKSSNKSLIKCQLIIMSIQEIDIITSLHNYFDLDKCAARLYIDEHDRICLRVPMDENSSPYSRIMKWNISGITNSNTSLARMEKYKTRGFIIEPFPCSCIICSDATVERIKCCNNIIHYKCIKKWSTCEEGQELTQKMLQCPCCFTWLKSSIKYVQYWDFEKYKYIKCLICNNFYREDRFQCSTVDSHDVPTSICKPCMLKMNPNIIYKGQKYACPNCGIIAEYKGGCQMLACCLYGPDKCKSGCTHGSSELIIFCGHKWTFNKTNIV